jgi:hypothetical protein
MSTITKKSLSVIAGAVFAAVLPSANLLAQDPSPLKIFTAVEVEFGTQSGKVYQLQGSSNLVEWVNIGAPVFGVGRDITQVFSTRSGGEVTFGSYRLEQVAAPTNGLAPWSLAGATLSLDDTPGDDLMQFTDATRGVDLGDDPDPFAYVFTRVDADTVRTDIDYGDGKKDVLTLTFTAPTRGTWVREEYRKERLKDRDLGVFSVVSNTVPNVNPNPGTPPPPPVDPGTTNSPAEPLTGLAGVIYQFQSGEHPDRLEFKDATTGLEIGDDVDDDEPNAFTYTYAVTGTNTATIVVTFKPGRHDDYELSFTSGGRGTFVRREFRNGTVKDTDNGAFSTVTGPSTPGGNGNDDNGGNTGGNGGNTGGNTNPGTAPAGPSLEGIVYRMVTGEDPDVLTFTNATAGVETGDDDPSSFTYTFTNTGTSTARLVVRFKPDRWDEYDLTFVGANGGTFVRREYDDNELKDTDSGTFVKP